MKTLIFILQVICMSLVLILADCLAIKFSFFAKEIYVLAGGIVILIIQFFQKCLK